MRSLVVRLLPDGSGRVRVHWFERLPEGPIETAKRVEMTAMGPLPLGGARGRIACNPKAENANAQVVNGETNLCVYSDDARAVTCPECMATEGFKAAMKRLEEIVPTAQMPAAATK